MRFVFTKLFYFLVALGLVPLWFSWDRPWLRWVALAYNILLIAAAFAESRFSQLPKRPRHLASLAAASRWERRPKSKSTFKTPPIPRLVDGERRVPAADGFERDAEGRVDIDAQSTATLIYELNHYAAAGLSLV